MDYGSKTLGLSISDRTGLIAGGYKTLRYENISELISELKDIVSKEKIDAFVLGNPKNLDNSLSDRSKLTLEFKEILEKEFNLKVYMQDERLSTVEAERLLISNNTKRNREVHTAPPTPLSFGKSSHSPVAKAPVIRQAAKTQQLKTVLPKTSSRQRFTRVHMLFLINQQEL